MSIERNEYIRAVLIGAGISLNPRSIKGKAKYREVARKAAEAWDRKYEEQEEIIPAWKMTEQEYITDQIQKMKDAKNPEAESPKMLEVLKMEYKQEIKFAKEDGLI